jgi:hypothetical protein
MAIYTYAQLISPGDQASHKTAILQSLQDAGFTGAFTWQSGASPLAFVETQADSTTRFDNNAAILAKGGLSDEAEDDTLTVLSDQVYDNQRMIGRRTRGRLLLVDAASVGPFTFQAESTSFSIGRGGRLYNGYGGTVTLPRGGQLLLNVESDGAGAIYALAPAGTITYFARGVLPGVTVTNQTDWLSGAEAQVGTDDESDPRLRTRNRSKWGSLGAGSPESAYRSWALSADPQVQRVAVLANVNMLDPGVATVLIAGASGALGGSVVSAVQNAIAPAQTGERGPPFRLQAASLGPSDPGHKRRRARARARTGLVRAPGVRSARRRALPFEPGSRPVLSATLRAKSCDRSASRPVAARPGPDLAQHEGDPLR